MSDLLNRLDSLGLTKNTSKTYGRAVYPVETVIDGVLLNSEKGKTFLAENDFPSGHRHGIVELFSGADITRLLEVQKIPSYRVALQNVIFLDTETTGLSGGTGTYAFMVGTGRFIGDHFRVRQFFMDGPAEETSLLYELEKELSGMNLLVTFNGKTFDLPLLRTRYVMNRLEAPFTDVRHLDLLHMSRRIFRNRLSDRSLGALERTVLGFERPGEEVPGYQIPQYFFNYLQSGDARPLAGVFEHNQWDILSMAALLQYYTDMISPVSNLALHSLDRIAIADLFASSGLNDLAETFYSVSFEEELPCQFVSRAAVRYSRLRKSRRDYQGAIDTLLQLGDRADIEVCRELIILYGHYLRDARESLVWINKAIELTNASPLPLYKRQALNNEFFRRKEAATKRINK